MTMDELSNKQKESALGQAIARHRLAHDQIETIGAQTASGIDDVHEAQAKIESTQSRHVEGLSASPLGFAPACLLFLLLVVTAFFDLLISGALMKDVATAAGFGGGWIWMGYLLPFGIVVVEAMYVVVLRGWSSTWRSGDWRLVPAWILAVLLAVALAVAAVLMAWADESVSFNSRVSAAIVMPVISIAFHLLIFFVPLDVLDASRHIGAKLRISQANQVANSARSRDKVNLGRLLTAARLEYLEASHAIRQGTDEEFVRQLSLVTQRQIARLDQLGTNTRFDAH